MSSRSRRPPGGRNRGRGRGRGISAQGSTGRSGSRSGRGWFHRFLVRRRRTLAGLLAAAACGIAVQALLPADTRTEAAVAVTADLPAGHLLEARDLRTARVPAGTAPPGSLAGPDAAAGERLAVPVRAGTILTDSYFVGPGLLAGAPEGTVAVPLRPADKSATGLLSPGVIVDVILASATGFDGTVETTVLAAGVPVLWTAGEAGAGGTWPGPAAEDAGLVVVAAKGQESAALAGAGERGNLYLVLSAR
ncbi:Flp pilus assembly protein CpaB [Arthrobacter caoxuetaonis]|uniref:RcpC/CpaB family pilus assembly protein n=1 Tax=Arthrobacter caoxuetaonis TaxID=2886935 RepID=A0A9X1MAZ3_9MICC|nr:RcpC/CpaB family pilus assembly protein [Arthrobacter caoxuetaonis]MCC3296634.1 RcpC/CpaB family pilus assembly protein [Arthrobacter caoxuetaonis]USQ56539.1 RcpC/CpaB family pilus assembly protein [Arthrobacter caoxuetaonis]